MSMLRNVFSTISTESVKHSSTGNDEKNSFLSDDKSHLSTKKENEEKKDISLPIPAAQDTTPYLSALPHQVLLYNTIPYLKFSALVLGENTLYIL